MSDAYDVLVIGAGPAGENAADIAARAGLRVGIVERELVGGECSYWACMPSKALLRPGEALAAVRRVPGAAEAVTGEIDVDAALARRDALSSNWDDAGQVSWLESANIELIRGHGRLAGEKTVEVESEDGSRTTYEVTTAVVIGTGTGSAVPPIDGLDAIVAWDNREATTAKKIPRRLAIVGGGVVGCELAQAWKSLGAEEVTIVEYLPTLLSREEPFAGEELAKAFDRLGIAVHTSAKVTSVRRDGSDGPVTVAFEPADGGDAESFEADEILLAAGRRPLTGDVGLETVGLEPGGYIEVDDHMRAVSVDGDWLYAVGDVNGRSLLTHSGKYQARIAGANIAGRDAKAIGDQIAEPRVVFTDPQIAAVGLTEAGATEAGYDVHTVEHNTGHVAGSATLGRGIRGTSKLVINADDRTLLGATFVGPGVGELLHAATVAIVGKVPLEQLWHAVPSFPTMSELWLRFLEGYRDKYGVELD